jgi:catechol 2,3-dioxygenase
MTRLGHVHLKVRDLDRAVEFYTNTLGLHVAERYGHYAFLSFGTQHHDLALQALGDDAADPGPGVGLYHSAWEVETPEELQATYKRLQTRGVSVTPVDHVISKALYFDDPDGNGVEVYLDTRETNDEYEWRGLNRQFDPEELSTQNR